MDVYEIIHGIPWNCGPALLDDTRVHGFSLNGAWKSVEQWSRQTNYHRVSWNYHLAVAGFLWPMRAGICLHLCSDGFLSWDHGALRAAILITTFTASLHTPTAGIWHQGVTKPIFSVPLFSTFSVIVKTNVSYWISRLYLAGVAVTPVKYECDPGNLTGTFAISKISLTEKLANVALVTPTPVLSPGVLSIILNGWNDITHRNYKVICEANHGVLKLLYFISFH